MIIGITGKARAGKDTVADAIIRNYPHARKVSIPDPIKEFLRGVYGFTDAQLYGKGKDIPDLRTGVIPRVAMIEFAVTGRKLWPDTWIQCALDKADDLRSNIRILPKASAGHDGGWASSAVIDRCDIVVIPSVRYVNDAQRIREDGGEIWRVVRPDNETTEGSAHESETTQDKPEFARLVSHTIRNDGTLEDLDQKVHDLLWPTLASDLLE